MCLLTIIVWVILVIGVIVIGAVVPGRDAAAYAGIVALVLGVVLPVVLNFWRPIFFRWTRKRQKLREALMSQGVLTSEDLERSMRYVIIREVRRGSEKAIKGTKQDAFLIIEDDTLRVLGAESCFTTSEFRIVPGCTGRCSRCWVIWACGGDDFRLHVTVNGEEREFLVQCREGRSLRDVARSTEMLEELVEADARAKTTETPKTDSAESSPAEQVEEPNPDKSSESDSEDEKA